MWVLSSGPDSKRARPTRHTDDLSGARSDDPPALILEVRRDSNHGTVVEAHVQRAVGVNRRGGQGRWVERKYRPQGLAIGGVELKLSAIPAEQEPTFDDNLDILELQTRLVINVYERHFTRGDRERPVTRG